MLFQTSPIRFVFFSLLWFFQNWELLKCCSKETSRFQSKEKLEKTKIQNRYLWNSKNKAAPQISSDSMLLCPDHHSGSSTLQMFVPLQSCRKCYLAMAIPCLSDVISTSFDLNPCCNIWILSMIIGLSFPQSTIHDTMLGAKTQREKMTKLIFILK